MGLFGGGEVRKLISVGPRGQRSIARDSSLYYSAIFISPSPLPPLAISLSLIKSNLETTLFTKYLIRVMAIDGSCQPPAKSRMLRYSGRIEKVINHFCDVSAYCEARTKFPK
jgi:hypothetical protein